MITGLLSTIMTMIALIFFIRNNLGDKWITFIEAYHKAFYRENLNKEIECIKVGYNLQVRL
jgi:hypothetical protein